MMSVDWNLENRDAAELLALYHDLAMVSRTFALPGQRRFVGGVWVTAAQVDELEDLVGGEIIRRMLT